ncbi:MAG: DUF3987 domain-containing protein [Prevotella sp.]|nr:DUF3987 domain-containing protein [Prevotella sp.]
MDKNHSFQFYPAPASTVVSNTVWGIREVYNYITTDMDAFSRTQELRDILKEVNAGKRDPKEVGEFKKKYFDFVCFSGTFSRRKDDGLIRHSGLLCLDFDHVGGPTELADLKEKLIHDTNFTTWLCFVSPSGTGLKWVIDIDVARADHQTWFLAVEEYVRETYGLEVDEKCGNVSRACFLPHDGDCYVRRDKNNKNIIKTNNMAATIDFDPVFWANKNRSRRHENEHTVAPSPVNNPQTASSEEEIRDLVSAITAHGAGFSDDYNDWLKIGFALAGELGERGRSYFHQLSQLSSKYDEKDSNEKYNNCLRNVRTDGSGVNIASLYYLAKNVGVDLSAFARTHHSNYGVSAISATSAIAPNSKKGGKSTILGISDDELALGAMALVALTDDGRSNGFYFSDKLKVENLDHILRTVYDLHHANVPKCDAMILGALNVCSGLMGGANFVGDERSGVYGLYDGRRVYAPLFNIIYSGAGNEKGNLVFDKQLASPIKNEMRRKYEAEKAEYDSAMAAWEAKGKKDRGEAPKKPVYLDPFVPGNSSSSAVYRALKANGGWGLMYETEADTVSSMLDSDYGNYSDLMRKAHHHEPLSMTRVTDDVHIDIEEPRLSILLTCTPGQLPSLFPSFENGLGSRFLFYYMPDEHVEFHDVFAMKDKSLDDIYKDLGEYFLPLYHALQQRAGHPIQFVMSEDQKKLFLDTYSEVLEEQFGMLGKGIRAFIFRLALENFRYAMILTVLRRLTDWQNSFNPSRSSDIFPDDENALVCDDRDFQTAMTIIGCLINHTARVYTVMAKEDDNPFANKGFKPTVVEASLYKLLPIGEFSTATVYEIAEKQDIPRRTAQRALSNLAFKYRVINPMKRGVYFKPEVKKG